MSDLTTQNIETALEGFTPSGDSYRLCFRDRLANLDHVRTATAIDDLICYGTAIDDLDEEQAVASVLETIIWGLSPLERAELNTLVKSRIRWNDPADCPRWRLWTLAEELTQGAILYTIDRTARRSPKF